MSDELSKRIEGVVQDHKEKLKVVHAEAERHGGTRAVFRYGDGILGIQFAEKQDIPDGWEKVPRETECYRPKGRKKEAAALKKTWKQAPFILEKLARRIAIEAFKATNFQAQFMSWHLHQVNGVPYMSTSNSIFSDAEATEVGDLKDHLTEIKWSEYCLACEAAETKLELIS